MENRGIGKTKVFDKLLMQSGGVARKRKSFVGFSPNACYSGESFIPTKKRCRPISFSNH
jgi:hypothetical protein